MQIVSFIDLQETSKAFRGGDYSLFSSGGGGVGGGVGGG